MLANWVITSIKDFPVDVTVVNQFSYPTMKKCIDTSSTIAELLSVYPVQITYSIAELS